MEGGVGVTAAVEGGRRRVEGREDKSWTVYGSVWGNKAAIENTKAGICIPRLAYAKADIPRPTALMQCVFG